MDAPAFENILTELAEHVGVDARPLVHSKELTVDGVPVGLFMQTDDDTGAVIQAACPVGTLPAVDARAVLRDLLHANAFGTRTGGATFGLQQGTDRIILAQCLDAAAGPEELAAMIGKLSRLALEWRQRLGLLD